MPNSGIRGKPRGYSRPRGRRGSGNREMAPGDPPAGAPLVNAPGASRDVAPDCAPVARDRALEPVPPGLPVCNQAGVL